MKYVAVVVALAATLGLGTTNTLAQRTPADESLARLLRRLARAT